MKSYDVGLVLFCDGACEPNPGVGGWAFVVYRNGEEIYAERGGLLQTTNNVMELTGALNAVRWLHANQERAPLICDSQYVVKGCNEWRHNWKRSQWKQGRVANLALWQELDAALISHPTQLVWCRGHSGIRGNERADELSLLGRQHVLSVAA